MKKFGVIYSRSRVGIFRRICALFRCQHKWRPGISSKSPLRYCDICEKTEELSWPEFYARFNRIPIL